MRLKQVLFSDGSIRDGENQCRLIGRRLLLLLLLGGVGRVDLSPSLSWEKNE